MKRITLRSALTINPRTITNVFTMAFLLICTATTFAQSAAPVAGLEVVAFADARAVSPFQDPTQVWVNDGSVYVTDQVDSTVGMISLANGSVVTVGGKSGQIGSVDGIGSASRFGRPAGVWSDGVNVYVSDSYFDTIRRISLASGEVTTLAGSANSPSESYDGIGALARFRTPQGIWGDGVNLYLCDSFNYTIRKIVMATGEVSTIAGTARTRGVADGFGAFARFHAPTDIWGADGYLYVADGSAIRKVTIATGEVQTIAGQAATSAYADGKGSNARFSFISGISGEGSNLLVADSGNAVIRQVSLTTGQVTTLAGSSRQVGASNGRGNAARFNSPSDISGESQSLFIADRMNSTIRRAVAVAALAN